LAVEVTERPFLQNVGTQLEKLWTQTLIKHEVSISADTSSLGECEMWWMSQDEGSDRQSRSLVHASAMGVEDARMTSVLRREGEREVRWYEKFLRADE